MLDIKYPIGKFQAPGRADAADRAAWIAAIEQAPAQVRSAIGGLTGEKLDTPYRDGGWTPRQVAHHLADSHMNAYVRFRLALTEDQPVIKPYDEKLWAELPDARTADPEVSLALLEALHFRWAALLRALPDTGFSRTMIHPEHGTVDLTWMLCLYAWHGRHHASQIAAMKERLGW